MDSNYTICRGDAALDVSELKTLYRDVFQQEDVAELADILFHHAPGLPPENWLLAREKNTNALAAACVLIPWTWEMEGVAIKVGEQGLVGTLDEHRKKGLMRGLNDALRQIMLDEGYLLGVIQGIPGFYHNFGYYYSVPLNNHIDAPFHIMPDELEDSPWTFAPAAKEDIPFLLEEDERYRSYYSISVKRDRAVWDYLLTHSKNTEYGSDYFITKHSKTGQRFYCRVPGQGFGSGLIVSEVSIDISPDAFMALLVFAKKLARERDKPYLRFDLHNDSPAGNMAIAMGAKKGYPYAWQISIPDKVAFLRGIAPVLEKRLAGSCFKGFSGVYRLEMFAENADLVWSRGVLEEVRPGTTEECPLTFCLNQDLFPLLALGHRTWRELQHTRPDIFPAAQHVRPFDYLARDQSAPMTDVLFPKTKSWVYERY
ncbi:GNAT family N-acetyltransferase [Desulfatibacillum aliphaticivorans]|uniref:GNAT family N-acetyltransferase n=1 Tax=Desulfatibacillum aliphaticivorans TaxID=218208 RepID=UPI00041D13B1|nr:GNAT family N-acetyltransferase [Desulfatibacillum aliphaticivorans]